MELSEKQKKEAKKYLFHILRDRLSQHKCYNPDKSRYCIYIAIENEIETEDLDILKAVYKAFYNKDYEG